MAATRLHFENFEYDEVMEILMDKETIAIRGSTLPNDYYVTIESSTLEQLKLSLLISNCMVTLEHEDMHKVQRAQGNVPVSKKEEL